MVVLLLQKGGAECDGDGDAEAEGAARGEARGENINVRAAYIHVLGDFLQSFGVLIAAIVIYYKVHPNI